MAKALLGHVGGLDPRIVSEMRRLQRRVADLEAELARLQEEKDVLAAEVGHQSSPGGFSRSAARHGRPTVRESPEPSSTRGKVRESWPIQRFCARQAGVVNATHRPRAGPRAEGRRARGCT